MGEMALGGLAALFGGLGAGDAIRREVSEENISVWGSIAGMCNDRARKLFSELDDHPENFDQMAGLIRLVMDIEEHVSRMSEG